MQTLSLEENVIQYVVIENDYFLATYIILICVTIESYAKQIAI